jgi:hypothetical protein
MAPLFALVEHAIPGRTRLRIPALRGDGAGLLWLAEGLRDCPGLSGIEPRPLTGSLLLRHQVPLTEVMAFAEGHGLLQLGGGAPIAPAPTPPSRPPPIGAPPRPAMPGEASPRHGGRGAFELVLIALLILAAGVQLYRGHLLEPATKLLWYALNLAQRLPPFGDA